MMASTSVKPPADAAQMLAARPLRLVEAQPASHGPGQWRLTVPLNPPGWARRFLRVPPGAKTFELDDLGKLVWDACDGKSTVRDVIGTLATRYDLSQREAQVATVAFLRTLMRKGLIGMAVQEQQK